MSTSLGVLPRIDVLHLARVTGVPTFHPEHTTFRPFPVYAFVVRHPDRPFVVDTGIGFENHLIDSLYPHSATRLVDELNRHDVDERDVQFIVNSHLHFDHCGQNSALSCPVVVQRAEVDAAQQPGYTVAEWAHVPPARAVVLAGDTELAPGVTALLAPGHTPGHQAVIVRGGDDVVVIAAQCIFRQEAWHAGPEATNLHDATWAADAAESLARLRALRPRRVLLSHDAPIAPANGPSVDPRRIDH